MNIITLTKLYDIDDIEKECSEQAKENLQIIKDNKKEKDFFNYLIDYEYSSIDDVTDLLHHDCEELFEALEIKD